MSERFYNSLAVWTLVYVITALLAYFFIYKLSWVKKRKIQLEVATRSCIRKQLGWATIYIITISGLGALLFWLGVSGWTKIYLDSGKYFSFYIPLSVAIYLIGFDVYFYVIHRILHCNLFYHAIHSVHHSVKTPTVLTVFCVHPAEVIAFYGYHLIMIFILPLHPIALLSVSLFIHQANIIGHFGYELFPASFARKVPFISSATYHDIHHQTGAHNYAYFFNWMDWIFKTIKSNYVEIYEDLFFSAKSLDLPEIKPDTTAAESI